MAAEARIAEKDIYSGKSDLLAQGHKSLREQGPVGIDSHSHHLGSVES